MCRSILQCVSVCCSVLQFIVVCCSVCCIVCWGVAVCRSGSQCVFQVLHHTLQHTATPCNTLQHAATHCNTLQHTATRCNTLQLAATRPHCNTLQHMARHLNLHVCYVCCSVLQRVAVCCSADTSATCESPDSTAGAATRARVPIIAATAGVL